MSYGTTDADRRLANVIQIGRVKAVDPAKGMVLVEMDGPETDWIPWTTNQAGGNRTWSCPDVGEQVVVAAPSGELGNAVVIGSLFQDSSPEPADSGDVTRTVYQDGTVVEYDRASHAMKIDVSASSGSVVIICQTATVQAAESVIIDTPETTCTGNLTVAKSLSMGSGGGSVSIDGPVAITGPSLTHNGKDVGSTMRVTGVTPGGGNSGVPV